jgi:2-succinyl-5-enolpyruvyl-6-hydroxy-3-cyclohexene-1-carboxylate synthase
MPTSKPLTQFLESSTGTAHVLVDADATWLDPISRVTSLVVADPALTFAALAEAIDGLATPSATARQDWARRWHLANCAARGAIASHLAEQAQADEVSLFADLAVILPDDATLVVGNSMPIRDLDTFFPTTCQPLRILGNRGANGIDGMVSTALGAAADATRAVILVIGDISFYHDLNGLLASRLHGIPCTIVLVHNDGGGIFSFLPQAGEPEHFEKLFGTPHGLEFAGAVTMYGGCHRRVHSRDEFRTATADAIARRDLSVIEIRSNRDANVAAHRAIWPVVSAAVRAAIAADRGG